MKKLLFSMALLLVAAASCNQKAPTRNADAEGIDSDSVIRLNCMIEVMPANRDTVIALSKELVDSSLNDEGNLSYDLYQSETRPTVLMIFETWKDGASLAAHSASAHFTRLVPAIQNLSNMTVQTFKSEVAEEKDSTLRLNCPIVVKPENRAETIEKSKELVAASLKDAGNLAYDIFSSTTDSTKLLIFESWQGQSALDKHSASAHFTRLVPEIQNLATMTVETFKYPKK